MIKIGDVIKLETGEHAVVIKITTQTTNSPDELVCYSLLKGTGEVKIMAKSEITDAQKTKHKIKIENVLDTLKMFDRADR